MRAQCIVLNVICSSVCVSVCGLWRACLIKSCLCILRTFFSSGEDCKTFWFYDESYFIYYSQSVADFFFPLQVKWCLCLVLAFKERDHWPTGWKITMKCIKSCPQNSGHCVFLNARVCCAYMHMCACIQACIYT